MAKPKQRLFGAHMPTAGGVEKAPLSAKSVGCASMQIFTKNQNQWRGKKLEKSSIEAYLRNLEDAGITHVASHDSYLINLASPDPAMYKKSFDAFIDEIERAALLKIPYLVFHPGSHLGTGEEAGLKSVAMAMNEAIKKTKHCPDVTLTIETTAGQGTNLGYRFEHIAYLLDKIKNKKRVGVCLDTCHVFAAGYEIRTKDGYKKTFREFDEKIGLDYLKIFHINDSKKDLASRVDRHEHIGKGFIGKDAFEFLVNDRRFYKTPMVLETPKGKDLAEDRENLALLKSLIR
jgi:deoxyribonuclease-4